MPLYEYLCEDCNHGFQLHRKVTERQSARCPRCSGSAKKVIGPVGIIFKGSGWHCTDYRKPEDSAKAGAEKKDKTPSAVGGEKSDEKAG